LESTKKKSFLDKLKFRYRVVVINDETFKEQTNFTLSLLNLIVFIGSVTLFFILLLIYIIAFTSLREYIPGYADVNLRRNISKVAMRSDSLLQASKERDLYIQNLEAIIEDRISKEDVKELALKEDLQLDTNKLRASENELKFRESMSKANRNSLSKKVENDKGMSATYFFTPLQGMVRNKFKSSTKHFAVDILAKPNEAIKSTLSGTVILATWTVETGYVIEVQHDNDLISVYKYNSVLLKKVGDKVKAGDAIAIIGNTGEQMSGPHLHFELWHKGYAVNPEQYIKF
jgi:lipoprotein NlpD